MVKKLLACALMASSLVSFAEAPKPGSTPLIVAHRGASFDAPENTLASFKLAWKQAADAIEGDFYLTADGKIITLHDATFKRTGGVDKKPSEMTLDEIRQLDVGAWKAPSFAGERAPTLAEVLAIVPAGKRMLIEVKCGPEILPALKEVIESSGLQNDQLTLICFKAEVIAESKKLMPQLKAFWLTSFKLEEKTDIKYPTVPEILDTLRACKADGIDAKADMDVVNDQFVKTMTAEGFESHFWTVDDPSVARQLKTIGALSITTNKPDSIRAAVETAD